MIGTMPLTYVVKHLLIINVLLFFGTLIVLGDAPYGEVSSETFHRGWLALHMPGSPDFRVYQVISHMFMHGTLGHLFFNMLSLYMFGPAIEQVWGPKRFLQYYMFCGLGAAALQLGINYWHLVETATPLQSYYGSLWGASGAIFGLYAAYAYLFPNAQISLLFPPVTLTAKWFVLIIGALELTYGFAPNNMSNIAHFAHVGGALFGLLLIWLWGGFSGPRKRYF
jgi:membrane associated rhomboid family serine protease